VAFHVFIFICCNPFVINNLAIQELRRLIIERNSWLNGHRSKTSQVGVVKERWLKEGWWTDGEERMVKRGWLRWSLGAG
jgi:hypothetical protein